MPAWRSVGTALIVLVVAVILGGCGAATQSPAKQDDRLRKAAGISTFRLVCSQDLWDRTGGKKGRGEKSVGPIPAKIGARNDGLVTVELTGPQLVDLLKYLDYYAHPGWAQAGTQVDPLARRMYDAIAPRVDAIQPNSQAVPEVVINDKAGGGATPASPSPSRSK